MRARGDLVNQRHRLAALELANSRLEEIRASGFESVKPATLDFDWRYLRRTGSNTWVFSGADPGETLTQNSRVFPITTEVRYMDIDGGIDTYDCLNFRVSIGYRPGLSDRISLETYVSP